MSPSTPAAKFFTDLSMAKNSHNNTKYLVYFSYTMVIYFRFIVWCEGLTQGFHTTGFSSYLWLKPAPVQVVPVKGTGFTGTGVVCHFSTLGLTLLFTTAHHNQGHSCWKNFKSCHIGETPGPHLTGCLFYA